MNTLRTISVIVTPGVVREGMTSRRGITGGLRDRGSRDDDQIHNYQPPCIHFTLTRALIPDPWSLIPSYELPCVRSCDRRQCVDLLQVRCRNRGAQDYPALGEAQTRPRADRGPDSSW